MQWQFNSMNICYYIHVLYKESKTIPNLMHSSFINRNSTGTFCRERKFPDGVKMDKVFDWVNDENAHGERFKDPRTGMEVDRWVIHEVSLYFQELNMIHECTNNWNREMRRWSCMCRTRTAMCHWPSSEGELQEKRRWGSPTSSQWRLQQRISKFLLLANNAFELNCPKEREIILDSYRND